jgi:hypothetical protein
MVGEPERSTWKRGALRSSPGSRSVRSEIGDEAEDPVEYKRHRRPVLVEITPAALPRDQNGGDYGKAEPGQADRMADPADDAQ